MYAHVSIILLFFPVFILFVFCAYIALAKNIFWVGNSFVLFTILYLNPRIVPESVYRCLHNKYLLKGSSTTRSASLLHSFYFTSFLNFILPVLFFILRFLFMNIYVRSVFLQVTCPSTCLSNKYILSFYCTPNTLPRIQIKEKIKAPACM